MRDTAGHFDLAEGTVVNWTMEVLRLILDRLFEREIRWPSPDEQRAMYTEWEGEKMLR